MDLPEKRPNRGFRTPRCSVCRLPEALCVCADLPLLAARTRLVVVMHERETITSTNTGRIAARMIEGAEVRIRGPWQTLREPLPEGRRLALFPKEGARVLGPEDASSEPVVLLVPDGTWAQARRVANRDPDLQGAEYVTLPPSGPSRYRLRSQTREGALCTLEAIAQALGILEGRAIEEALIRALDHFVDRGLMSRSGVQNLPQSRKDASAQKEEA